MTHRRNSPLTRMASSPSLRRAATDAGRGNIFFKGLGQRRSRVATGSIRPRSFSNSRLADRKGAGVPLDGPRWLRNRKGWRPPRPPLACGCRIHVADNDEQAAAPRRHRRAGRLRQDRTDGGACAGRCAIGTISASSPTTSTPRRTRSSRSQRSALGPTVSSASKPAAARTRRFARMRRSTWRP